MFPLQPARCFLPDQKGGSQNTTGDQSLILKKERTTFKNSHSGEPTTRVHHGKVRRWSCGLLVTQRSLSLFIVYDVSIDIVYDVTLL